MKTPWHNLGVAAVLVTVVGCQTLQTEHTGVRGWYSDKNGTIKIMDGYADYDAEPLERVEYRIVVYGFDFRLNAEERGLADSRAGYKILNKHFSGLPMINYNTDKKKNYYIWMVVGPWKNGSLPDGRTQTLIQTYCFNGLHRIRRQIRIPPEHCHLTFTHTNQTLRVDGRIAFDLPDLKANLRFNTTVCNPPVYRNRAYRAPWEEKVSKHEP